MVELRKYLTHLLIYLLINLAMLLPVVTAKVDRAFSSINIVKTRLRKRIGDEWLNGSIYRESYFIKYEH